MELDNTESPWAEAYFSPHYSSVDCFLSARRQKTIITVGGHECTLRLILPLRFEVTQQDMGSIPHLTMRQEKRKRKKKKTRKGEKNHQKNKNKPKRMKKNSS